MMSDGKMDDLLKGAIELQKDRDDEQQQIVNDFKDVFKESFTLSMNCISTAAGLLKAVSNQAKKIEDDIKNMSLLKRILRYFGFRIYVNYVIEYNKAIKYLDFINSKKDEIESMNKSLVNLMHKLEHMHYAVNKDEYPNTDDISKTIIKEYQKLHNIDGDVLFIYDKLEIYRKNLMEIFE